MRHFNTELNDLVNITPDIKLKRYCIKYHTYAFRANVKRVKIKRQKLQQELIDSIRTKTQDFLNSIRVT